MRAPVTLAAMLLAQTCAALAQTPPPAPFDMSGERGPATPPPVAPPATPSPPTPGQTQPRLQPPAATVPRVQATPTVQSPVQPAVTVAAPRYLLQKPQLRLDGEISRKGWSFYLTPEQAASVAKLNLAWRSAVVVAPELSQLDIFINDAPVVKEAISAAEYDQRRVFDIPPGALRPGLNRISFQASQRHRTDCTPESTFELWTDIIGQETFLSFADAKAGKMIRLEDMRAIGVDMEGRSRFRMVAPALEQAGPAASLLRLSQGLALQGNATNASFTFSKTAGQPPGPGEMVVIAGTRQELATLGNIAPAASGTGAMAGFIDFPGQPGTSALVFTGPDWSAVSELVDNFLAYTGTAASSRDVMPTSAFMPMDTPLMRSGGSTSFSNLGVPAQEFSGRRFSTGFSIGIPPDFYANAYGNATILLDAAYSSEVLPGSQINVYVNGNIASTVPVAASGGAILRHLPIKVTMRHFRPGVNRINLEAVLLTRADAVCAPGATASEAPRLAIFGTSEFVMPDFAHMARAPDLAATAGMAFPYDREAQPVSVVLGRNDADTLASAANIIGKLTVMARNAFPFEVTGIEQARGRDALFFGIAADLPQPALGDITLEAEDPQGGGAGSGRADINVDDWKSKISAGSLQTWLAGFGQWMKDTFNLDLASMNLLPGSNPPYTVPQGAGAFMAQQMEPESGAIWTVVSARDAVRLRNGTAAMAEQDNWEQIGGRIAFYQGPQKPLATVAPEGTGFIRTVPLSFNNMRLVITNWLSENSLYYALGLIAAATLLGLFTSGLMGALGRHDDQKTR